MNSLNVDYSDSELRCERPDDDSSILASTLLRTNGCLILDNVLDLAEVQALAHAFNDRHDQGLRKIQQGGALRVGDLRQMITVDIDPPFDSRSLLENPFVTPILRQLLGDSWVLSSFNAVVSLPGAAIQHRHTDYVELFPGFPPGLLPPYAITMYVPLVDMDDATGTTRLWPKSHLRHEHELDDEAFVDPVVPVGSVGMFDYRLTHRGLPNVSTSPRPILYLVYSRPWFRDSINYKLQPQLRIGRETVARMAPERVRRFGPFVTADEPG